MYSTSRMWESQERKYGNGLGKTDCRHNSTAPAVSRWPQRLLYLPPSNKCLHASLSFPSQYANTDGWGSCPASSASSASTACLQETRVPPRQASLLHQATVGKATASHRERTGGFGDARSPPAGGQRGASSLPPLLGGGVFLLASSFALLHAADADR